MHDTFDVLTFFSVTARVYEHAIYKRIGKVEICPRTDFALNVDALGR